jgi:NAD(P)-dependent dehydrogenase (short-subunit alcohol dehydrogenase family)
MKTVLITGANKGIGFETAKQLAKSGYFVYLASRDQKNGKEAVQKLKDEGVANVESIVIDVTDAGSVRKAKQELEGKIDALDILINNAGISGTMPQELAAGGLENLRTIFETNFFGVIQVTQEFLPLLKKSKQPAILNVSSEVGSLAVHTAAERNPNRARFHAYGCSKTALNGFTVMLANELSGAGISVNSVTPGYTATDLNQFEGGKTAEQGAAAIVRLAKNPVPPGTARFFKDGGEVEW